MFELILVDYFLANVNVNLVIFWLDLFKRFKSTDSSEWFGSQSVQFAMGSTTATAETTATTGTTTRLWNWRILLHAMLSQVEVVFSNFSVCLLLHKCLPKNVTLWIKLLFSDFLIGQFFGRRVAHTF